MAKLELRPQEELLAKEAASHVMNMLFIPQANPGKLTVTNQRIKFDESRLKAEFEYDLTEIDSISVGMASTLTINCKDGKKHKITGMFNKKLISAMEESGIRKE